MGYIKVLRILISINRKRSKNNKKKLCVDRTKVLLILRHHSVTFLLVDGIHFLILIWLPVQQGLQPMWTINAPSARCGCEWHLKEMQETEACLTGGGVCGIARAWVRPIHRSTGIPTDKDCPLTGSRSDCSVLTVKILQTKPL